MRVTRGYTTNPAQPMTDPFPSSGRNFYLALHGGDVAEPIGFGTNWFQPPYPKRVWRWFCKRNVLPFLSWQFGSRKGYIGFKCYGVDAPAYRDWLCDPSEVYDGSLALCITARNGLTALPFLVMGALLCWLSFS